MKTALSYFKELCEGIERDGLTKNEKIITSPQGARVILSDGREVINMCANNYLGLGNNPEVISSAIESYKNYGYGLSSVRFICGTQSVHKHCHLCSGSFRKERKPDRRPPCGQSVELHHPYGETERKVFRFSGEINHFPFFRSCALSPAPGWWSAPEQRE